MGDTKADQAKHDEKIARIESNKKIKLAEIRAEKAASLARYEVELRQVEANIALSNNERMTKIERIKANRDEEIKKLDNEIREKEIEFDKYRLEVLEKMFEEYQLTQRETIKLILNSLQTNYERTLVTYDENIQKNIELERFYTELSYKTRKDIRLSESYHRDAINCRRERVSLNNEKDDFIRNYQISFKNQIQECLSITKLPIPNMNNVIDSMKEKLLISNDGEL